MWSHGKAYHAVLRSRHRTMDHLRQMPFDGVVPWDDPVVALPALPDRCGTAPYRRVAPSYGFDIVPVMHHAWRAAALSALLRVTVAGAVVAPTVAGALATAVLVACGLALLWLLRLAMLLRDVDREPRPKRKSKRRGLGPVRGHQHLFRLLFPRRYSEKAYAFRRIGFAALSQTLAGLTIALTHPGQAMTAFHMAVGITLVCLGVGAARQLILVRQGPW